MEVFHEYPAFTLYRCLDCDFIMNSLLFGEEPEGVRSDAENESLRAAAPNDLAQTFVEHSLFQLTLVSAVRPDGRTLLEIGPGTGEFLHLSHSAGWEVCGIEPSAAACADARQKYGLKLIPGQWNRRLVEGRFFDAVVFWQVLEHLADPLGFLREAASVLNPDGLLIFSLPNRSAFVNSVLGTKSPLFSNPGHLYHYTASNVRRLAQKASLKVISLFSREEPIRFLREIGSQLRFAGSDRQPSIEDQMAVIGHLQGTCQGHELYCVAGLSSRESSQPGQADCYFTDRVFLTRG
ncbi:MAG: class I SAM-dependent methyltransferase [Solirubrobacterales bacterium]